MIPCESIIGPWPFKPNSCIFVTLRANIQLVFLQLLFSVLWETLIKYNKKFTPKLQISTCYNLSVNIINTNKEIENNIT